MNFSDAIIAMLEGKAVCLPEWDKSSRMKINKTKKCFVGFYEYGPANGSNVNHMSNWTGDNRINRNDWKIWTKTNPNKEKAKQLRKKADELFKQAKELESSI